MPRDLRQLARGQPCYMRLTGCTHDREQTVLAHIRRGSTAGAGQKPPDVCGVPMCEHCHGVYDGRYKDAMSRAELDAEALRAQNQWLAWLWKNEVLLVCA